MAKVASLVKWPQARVWMPLVEAAHFVVGGFCSFVATMVVAVIAWRMVQRFGNWGVSSGHDAWAITRALPVLAYGVGTLYSAQCMDRRRRRSFSVAWCGAHAATIIGLPLALVTWLLLTRTSVRAMYREAEDRAPGFVPQQLPPPVPVPAIPVAGGERGDD